MLPENDIESLFEEKSAHILTLLSTMATLSLEMRSSPRTSMYDVLDYQYLYDSIDHALILEGFSDEQRNAAHDLLVSLIEY